MESLPATIRLLSPGEGGRGHPIDLSYGYLPHLRVGSGDHLGVRVRSDFQPTMEPGASGTVILDLLYDIDYSVLGQGVSFEILEGNRRVGNGHIL